jgi:hypothetical protein
MVLHNSLSITPVPRGTTSMAELHHQPGQLPVQNLVALYKSKSLNLCPGFQRNSVWSLSDRRKLIDTICRNYPLPPIFLYRRKHNGDIIYDVIDGKQRLETILMFVGAIRGGRFEARLQLPNDPQFDVYDWNAICKRNLQYLINGYDLRTIEVDGDPGTIIDLFVRINSTGKALSAAEKRHAHYYQSEFLRAAARLADKHVAYFQNNKIIGPSQVSRMKHVELMCELIVSINQGDVINKKLALDSMLEPKSLSTFETKRALAKTVTALNRVKRLLPDIASTRFNKLSDFYTLTVLMAKFENEKLALSDRKRNHLAHDLLIMFSNGVDSVSQLHKKLKSISPNQELYRQYLLTALEGTDDLTHRRTREQILRGAIQSLFEQKDTRRCFSLEQRRILWNTSSARKCNECGKQLTWQDFTIDHIDPYSKGGKTKLDNAALMCRKHNSSKGNR